MIILNPKLSEAFQRGLDSYYEDWDSAKLALIMFQYNQDDETEVLEHFEAGRERAESDNEI